MIHKVIKLKSKYYELKLLNNLVSIEGTPMEGKYDSHIIFLSLLHMIPYCPINISR